LDPSTILKELCENKNHDLETKLGTFISIQSSAVGHGASYDFSGEICKIVESGDNVKTRLEEIGVTEDVLSQFVEVVSGGSIPTMSNRKINFQINLFCKIKQRLFPHKLNQALQEKDIWPPLKAKRRKPWIEI